MENDSGTIIDTGCDWFTCTFADSKAARHAIQKATIHLSSEHQNGNEKRHWSAFGYEGFQCGGIRFGTRHDGLAVMLSGPTAQQHWPKYFKHCSNVSRFDLQVTVRYERPSHTVLAQHYKKAQRYHRKKIARRRVTLLKSTDHSATIYLGSRSSERYGRVYQKDAESRLDHYSKSLRYEIEFKGAAALEVAKHLSGRHQNKDTGLLLITTWFKDSGIDLLSLKDDGNSFIRVSRSRSDNIRRLEWLRLHVSSSVQELIEAGQLLNLIEALGLAKHVHTVGQYPAVSQSDTQEVLH